MRKLAVAFVACLLGLSPMAWADCALKGTWVQRGATKEFTMTMTVEDAGPACKLTYRVTGANVPAVGSTSTIVSRFDGKDAPHLVDGKPTGQTLAIRQIDNRHWVSVMKHNGKETGISKGEMAPDGRVLKVVNEMSASGPSGTAQKSVQFWDKR